MRMRKIKCQVKNQKSNKIKRRKKLKKNKKSQNIGTRYGFFIHIFLVQKYHNPSMKFHNPF
jgi:hypothetical protein